jgi:hypothetical protein
MFGSQSFAALEHAHVSLFRVRGSAEVFLPGFLFLVPMFFNLCVSLSQIW